MKTARRILAILAGLATLVGLGFISTAPASAATTYYFSQSTGVDTNPCTTALPCQSLTKAQSMTLAPGDGLAFLRSDVWTGGLDITQSGSSVSRINLYGYGTGSSRPKLTGGASGVCFKLSGDYINIDNLDARVCGYAGYEVHGNHITIQKSSAQTNEVGIRVAATATDVMIGGANSTYANTIKANVTASSNTSGPFGVLLNGPGIVAYNNISAQDNASDLYGRDGSGVEIFDASNSWIHHNTIFDNNAGVEMGGTGSGNSIESNVIYSDPATNGGDNNARGIIVAPGMTGTWMAHNSIDILGTTSEGIVCSSTCDAGTQIKDSAVKATAKSLYVGNQNIAVKNSVWNGTVQGETLDATNSTATIGWTSPPSDLTETASSPTVNFGSTAAPGNVDRAGNPMPFGGTVIDAGAYELQVGTPDVVTNNASSVGTTTATLNGTVNPNGTSTTYQYEYGTTTSYGSVFPTSAGSAGSGTAPVSKPENVTGLTTGTLYHYRLRATNSYGTTNGSDKTFTTGSSDHIVAAVGDTCSTSGTTQQCAKTATAVSSFSPERLIHLGDYQYQNAGSGGATYQAGYQAAFSGLHNITIPTFGSTHDTDDGSGIWEGYPVSYMNSNGAPEVQGNLSDHQWGYGTTIGGWQVVVFNYKTGAGDGGSVASVDSYLDAHPSSCLLAVTHGSMIGSPSSEHPTNESSAFKQTLIDHGVDLVLNGHQHWYERNLDASGFTAVTNGQGGIGHYSRTSTASTAQAYNDTSFGPTKVTLKSAGWESDFVPNVGAASFTDHASGTCGS